VSIEPTAITSPIRGLEAQWFLSELVHHLPGDIQVLVQLGVEHRLWAQLHIADKRYWVSLSAISGTSEPQGRGVSAAILLSVTLTLIATVAAYLLHRRINRPLKYLVSAAQRLGEGCQPEPVPVEGPTEIATVAEAFNAMTKRLSDNEAARSLMLAGISHDIRTPLTKLRLAMEMRDDPEVGLSSAERFIEDIDTIVKQFIDFARGTHDEDAVIGNLNELIKQLVADFAGLGHDFACELAPLPAIRYKPISLLRVFMNLMQNAAIYGGTGLAIRTSSEGKFAYVQVTDTGPGVPPEALSHLMQPFSRGPDSAGKASGAGLGLAIANHIVNHHGGQLKVTTRSGGGFEALVSIPIEVRFEPIV
jgi:two-component system osmolarity sensor histidine kinase EnvZ